MQLDVPRLNHAEQSFREQYGREPWYAGAAADPQRGQIIIRVNPDECEDLGPDIQDDWEGFPLSWRDLEPSGPPAGPSSAPFRPENIEEAGTP